MSNTVGGNVDTKSGMMYRGGQGKPLQKTAIANPDPAPVVGTHAALGNERFAVGSR